MAADEGLAGKVADMVTEKMRGILDENNQSLLELLRGEMDTKLGTLRDQLREEMRNEIARVEGKVNQAAETMSVASTAADAPHAKRRAVGISSSSSSVSEATASGSIAPGQGEERNPRRICIGGFPRKLLASQRRARSEIVKSRIPDAVASAVEIKAYNLSTSYSVVFPTETAVREFLERAKVEPLAWADPRGGNVPLRARTDKPLDVRQKTRALGELWTLIISNATAAGKWGPKFKLGTNGYKGVIFATDEEDIWELFTVSLVEGGEEKYRVEPELSNLSWFGIGEAGANELRDEAIAKA